MQAVQDWVVVVVVVVVVLFVVFVLLFVPWVGALWVRRVWVHVNSISLLMPIGNTSTLSTLSSIRSPMRRTVLLSCINCCVCTNAFTTMPALNSPGNDS